MQLSSPVRVDQLIPETDIIRDGIVEQVDTLEHKGTIFHQGIHVVILYISFAQNHGSGIYMCTSFTVHLLRISPNTTKVAL